MKTLVIIPTYNEACTLPGTLSRLRAAVPRAHVLIADDASPDGTGQIADQLAAQDSAVHVLHRRGKEGLGPAYIAGFRWGLAHDYDVLVEMDADASHRPEQLPKLLDAIEAGADVAIGSRWVRGGRVHNWPWRRLLLSRGANFYVRCALGLPVADATAGFRAMRADTLRSVLASKVASQGYCFQVDMTRRALGCGARLVECPIDFDERVEGASKMTAAIVREALLRVTVWGIEHRARQLALGGTRFARGISRWAHSGRRP
ncbi:polyprenol monophosphomannose synthase [Devriesea agamarum]|uniref:polyprenol monophosphomannose synthase n=1 Tax=Devriesea agamarum TaxID=472569 RepID=UPI00071D443E|nr:polyprenol monophosphomannose synthase [Devriesea agamarum]